MTSFGSDTAYDAFMGRYSTRLAPLFADFAGVARDMRVLDVGAGTGALTDELVGRGADVAAADPAAGFVTALRLRFPMVQVKDASAEELPWPSGAFDVALAQLVVAFMSDPSRGIREMHRVVRPGGTVAVCMWDRHGMQMLTVLRRAREALGAIDPTSEVGMRYRTREELASLLASGFDQIATDLLEVQSGYSGFDEFWEALCGGANQSGRWAASLTGDALEAARAEVYRQLEEPSGAFTLGAQAWAVRGRRNAR